LVREYRLFDEFSTYKDSAPYTSASLMPLVIAIGRYGVSNNLSINLLKKDIKPMSVQERVECAVIQILPCLT
jgi:hypothetical protein